MAESLKDQMLLKHVATAVFAAGADTVHDMFRFPAIILTL